MGRAFKEPFREMRCRACGAKYPVTSFGISGDCAKCLEKKICVLTATWLDDKDYMQRDEKMNRLLKWGA